jgi:endoglycosylceramidase
VGAPLSPAGLHQLVDSQGRTTLLKGVNINGLIDYYRSDLAQPYPSDPGSYANAACPRDDPSVLGVPFCRSDFSQLRPLGYNVLRLAVSWSRLEPAPGTIDQSYVERIAQVVGWAKAAGIYVMIDLHQDAWSKYLYSAPGTQCAPGFQAMPGFDGAPQWASQHASPVCALHGVRELDPAVAEDFQKLYSDVAAPDGVGLQEHYADVMLALARRFADEPAVVGYEILNEPSPGLNAAPSASDSSEIFPFYGKVVNTVTRALPHFRQLFFIEPNVQRDVTDHSAIVSPWSAYSSYRNVVYAPHIYTGVFTADQEVASQRFFPSDEGYRSAIQDASALGLPLWIGEFGNDRNDDETILRTHYDLQDRYLLGGALWDFKEHGRWGVYAPPYGAGMAVPSRVKFSSRTYPLVTAGTLQALGYDPDGHGFEMRGDSGRVALGDRGKATVVFIPSAATGDFTAQNARLELVDAGGNTEVLAYPLGGPYRLAQAATG